jgi:hypothetical protein
MSGYSESSDVRADLLCLSDILSAALPGEFGVVLADVEPSALLGPSKSDNLRSSPASRSRVEKGPTLDDSA